MNTRSIKTSNEGGERQETGDRREREKERRKREREREREKVNVYREENREKGEGERDGRRHDSGTQRTSNVF